jgi:hypothetical protein
MTPAWYCASGSREQFDVEVTWRSTKLTLHAALEPQALYCREDADMTWDNGPAQATHPVQD